MKVFRTRTTDVFVTLAERAKRANAAGVGLFYSLHVNGFIDPAALGYDTHAHPQCMAQTKAVQAIVQKHLGALFVKWGSRDRGVKFNDFQVLRDTKMSAILTENGFMSNPKDMENWRNPVFVNELATVHKVAILEAMTYLGVDSVWLDEGHGGNESPGAVAADGTQEADLVLMLADKIEAKLMGIEEVDAVPVTYAPRPGENYLLYPVQAGETLTRIAPKFNTTWSHLQEVNKIVDVTKIPVGHLLWVPMVTITVTETVFQPVDNPVLVIEIEGLKIAARVDQEVIKALQDKLTQIKTIIG